VYNHKDTGGVEGYGSQVAVTGPLSSYRLLWPRIYEIRTTPAGKPDIVSLRRLYEELKRRHVFRVTGLYLIGAYAVIQAATTVFPFSIFRNRRQLRS
jgi:hypothetical protein